MRAWVTAAAAAIGGLVLAATASAQSPTNSWWERFEADARLVPLPDGRRLNLYCEGQGAPTVILEAGLGSSSSAWRRVQDEIARTTKACAYDRAGLGHSPPGPLPRDTRAIVADLEQLLKAAELPGPYVLVGHSMGAYSMRVFATRRREDVVGLVLVDPSTERQRTRFAALLPQAAALEKADSGRRTACARAERPVEVKGCVLLPSDIPPALLDRFLVTQGQGAFATALAENEAFGRLDSAEVIAERRPLGPLPLLILTASKVELGGGTDAQKTALHTEWMKMHDETAALSTVGVNRLVPGAGHAIQREKPQAVIDAVTEVIADARRR
jgi:pimeloyl-ACP methyl ester carboxylesterase